jgi:hypothetical protein
MTERQLNILMAVYCVLGLLASLIGLAWAVMKGG